MKFGVPMVLNPVILVPMSLTPVISILIAYFATVIVFLPRIGVNIPWSVPLFVSGFLASGWQGIVVQVIQMIACFLIYLPFVKYYDKMKLKE